MNPRQLINWFVDNKIAVIPVSFQSKSPKQTWKRFQATLPSANQLDNWFSREPYNWGVVAGWQNLVIIDFDNATEYVKWRMWARKQGGTAQDVSEKAWQVQTSRGVHIYIRTANTERNRKLPGLDIKAKNGYVLGAYSTHPSGAIYTPMRDNIYIPLVVTLSDVLPSELLTQATVPDYITLPSTKIPVAVSNDPWSCAENAKVNERTIQELKSKFRIESLFANTEKTGAHYLLACCPLHDDGNPSMWIDTQSQICGCFSGCTSKPLDVINLTARLYGMTNKEAIQYLARMI